MEAVTTVNALNKSLSKNNKLSKKNTYLKTEVFEYKNKYGKLYAYKSNILKYKKNYKLKIYFGHKIHKNYYSCYKKQA